MTDPYVDFFLNSPPSVKQLDLIEISHPAFSQTYRYVRNQRGGVTVTLPNDGVATFEYRPVNIRRLTESDDLSQGLAVDVGDPGEVLALEHDNLAAADGFTTKPTLRYWVYRSDELTVPMLGPLVYEVQSFATKGEMATIDASAPERNASGTGERYTFNRFPMLRGYV
jgi:hypothetical protein